MKELLGKIFSKEDVNAGRQYEFDYVKALCILIMVVMHTYIYLCPTSVGQSGTLSYFITVALCTIFGASTFMICMGIGFCYTKNKDNSDFFIKRGIKILILAYVLNFLRTFTNIFFVSPIVNGSFFSERFFIDIFNVDIMQFAGLAMIFFGLLLKFKLKPLFIFIIGVILSIIASFFPYVSTNIGIIDLLLGAIIPNKYLVGNHIYSCFPIISYFIYPAFGYLYGLCDKKIKDKKLFYTIVTPICGIIAITYSVIATKNNFYCLTDLGYYHPRTYDCFINMMATVFLFGVFYFISNYIPKIVEKVVVFTSSHINTVYCIHWVILYNLYSVVTIMNGYKPREYEEIFVTIIGICIYCISVIATKIYSDYKNSRKEGANS